MENVRITFNDRVSEIELYFTFIGAQEAIIPNVSLKRILKSNLILMLYNLIESTILNAVEEIHNNIHSNNISFNDLKTELKETVIKHLKDRNSKNFVASINDIALDIVKKSFDKKKIFSGNVDGKEIRELSIKYGFSADTTFARTKHGRCLVDIKGKRNDLAHGIFSFTEIGKEYSLEDLQKMKDESCNYLEEIINNIDAYLTNKDYKEVVV